MGLNRTSKNLNKNEKFLIGVVAVMAIGYIVYTFIIVPSQKKIKPLQDEVKNLKQQVQNIDFLEVNIAKKEKELAELSTQYEEASKSIPKTDRYPQVIRDLKTMASSTGVKITNMGLGKPIVVGGQDQSQGEQSGETQVAGLQSFTVNLTFEGNYNQTLDYIKQLESDKRILEIINFSTDNKTTSLTVVYFVAGGAVETENYDFNTNGYGKNNLFD